MGEWVNGESFLYLGSSYRLLLVNEQDEPLKLKDGRFQLLRSVIESAGREGAQQAFENFFQTKGLPRIAARVAHFASRAGVAPGKVHVVPGKLDAAALSQRVMAGNGRATLTTASGDSLVVTASGSNVMVTDEKGGTAMVSIANVYQSNGVIHVVNKVLVPN